LNKAEYHRYLASREWALLKQSVRERSHGTCERCRRRPHDHTHHVTYEPIGQERLDDLLGVCEPCHMFLSGIALHDPATAVRSCSSTADYGFFYLDKDVDLLIEVVRIGPEVDVSGLSCQVCGGEPITYTWVLGLMLFGTCSRCGLAIAGHFRRYH
jgi:hypothetical protein